MQTPEPTDSTLLDLSMSTLRNLLEAHWKNIKDLASDEEAESKAKVQCVLTLDWSGKVPAGAWTISYVRSRTKDSAAFHTDDTDQLQIQV